MTSYEMLKLSVWKTEDLTQRMEIKTNIMTEDEPSRNTVQAGFQLPINFR